LARVWSGPNKASREEGEGGCEECESSFWGQWEAI
jgi:hypothetical protein